MRLLCMMLVRRIVDGFILGNWQVPIDQGRLNVLVVYRLRQYGRGCPLGCGGGTWLLVLYEYLRIPICPFEHMDTC